MLTENMVRGPSGFFGRVKPSGKGIVGALRNILN